MDSEQQACQNTDKTLYKEPHSDHWGSFDDSLFVTTSGGIGINVGGTVYVMPLKEWHKLAVEKFPIPKLKL